MPEDLAKESSDPKRNRADYLFDNKRLISRYAGLIGRTYAEVDKASGALLIETMFFGRAIERFNGMK